MSSLETVISTLKLEGLLSRVTKIQTSDVTVEMAETREEKPQEKTKELTPKELADLEEEVQFAAS